MLASWTKPPLLYEYDPAQKKVNDTGLQPLHPVDMSGYESVEVKAKSHDGALVPLSIIYRKNVTRDGSHPALLEGYGAYGVTLDPNFLAMKLALAGTGRGLRRRARPRRRRVRRRLAFRRAKCGRNRIPFSTASPALSI